jgi:hypothetical protein
MIMTFPTYGVRGRQEPSRNWSLLSPLGSSGRPMSAATDGSGCRWTAPDRAEISELCHDAYRATAPRLSALLNV